MCPARELFRRPHLGAGRSSAGHLRARQSADAVSGLNSESISQPVFLLVPGRRLGEALRQIDFGDDPESVAQAIDSTDESSRRQLDVARSVEGKRAAAD